MSLTGPSTDGGMSAAFLPLPVLVLALLALVAVGVVSYVLSLRLHPYRSCRSCRGAGRHRGAVFGYAQRTCTTCGGSGRRIRYGNRNRDLPTH